MTTYEKEASEVERRIKELYARKERFQNHGTLHTRVYGVVSEIEELEKILPKMYATIRWDNELRERR